MQYRCRPDAVEKQRVMSFFRSQHVAIISQASPFSVCGIHVSASFKLTCLWVMSTNGERQERELQRKVNILLYQTSVHVWAGACPTFKAAKIGSHKIMHLSETERCSRARPPGQYDIWETRRLGPAGGGGTGV